MINEKIVITYDKTNEIYHYNGSSFDYLEDALSGGALLEFNDKNKVKISTFNEKDNCAILSAINNNQICLYYDFKTIDLFKVVWEFDNNDETIIISIIKIDENFPLLEKVKNMTLKEYVDILNIALKENFDKEEKEFLKVRDIGSLSTFGGNDTTSKLKINTNFYFSFTKNDVFVNHYRKAPLFKMKKKAKEVSFRTKELFLYSLEIIEYPNDEKLSNLINLTYDELGTFIKNENNVEKEIKENKNKKEHDTFTELLKTHDISKEDFIKLYEKFNNLPYDVKKQFNSQQG